MLQLFLSFQGQLSDTEVAGRCVVIRTGTTIREMNSEFSNSMVLVKVCVFTVFFIK